MAVIKFTKVKRKPKPKNHESPTRKANKFFGHCLECGKALGENEVLLCDGRISQVNDFRDGTPLWFKLCSAPLCPACATSKHGKDYCSFHAANPHEIADVPNSGKYKDWREQINKHLPHHSSVWDFEMAASSPTAQKGLFFCKISEIGF